MSISYFRIRKGYLVNNFLKNFVIINYIGYFILEGKSPGDQFLFLIHQLF